ncbi:MAG: hypothetical protein QG623_671, partial [Patescibacteria group bacterium]|nr:hypothetical protein [Patescibacteria group bacterium]
PGPTPTPGPTFYIGNKVRSRNGATGVVTGFAPDGMPLVTYDGPGKPVANTKPENLTKI